MRCHKIFLYAFKALCDHHHSTGGIGLGFELVEEYFEDLVTDWSEELEMGGEDDLDVEVAMEIPPSATSQCLHGEEGMTSFKEFLDLRKKSWPKDPNDEAINDLDDRLKRLLSGVGTSFKGAPLAIKPISEAPLRILTAMPKNSFPRNRATTMEW